jgi:hypothetical protein
MISNRPKFLKAVLFTNNISEVGAGVVQSQCFTVQDYHYHCFRSRDDQGNPFGSILSDYLDFSVVVSDLDACKFFYQAMEQNDSTPMSFLFNATFSPTGRMTDFEDGLVTYGYVIGVDEDCANNDETGNEQVLIHVRMQLCNMFFLGSNNVHYLEITKD